MNLRSIKTRDLVVIAITFLIVFVLSFTVLYMLDFVPNELIDQKVVGGDASGVSSTTVNIARANDVPVRITIQKIGVDSIIQNPTSANLHVLDDLLTHGAVRYPGSGLAGEGNMFLFGHSTSFKVVNNQAYKTFNGLKSLMAGDMISVFSATKKYTYKVTKVSLVNSEDTTINLDSVKPKLTLSSCNTLGAKEQRYLVEADYVGSSVI